MSNEGIEYTTCAGCISHSGKFLGQGGDFNHHEQAGNQLYRDHKYPRALIPCQHGHNKKYIKSCWAKTPISKSYRHRCYIR
jgi:hypothetical protein